MSEYPSPDWPRLLSEHLAGRPGADAVLIRSALPVVDRAVRPLVQGPDRDDAVQEASLDILNKAYTVREPAAFGAWVRAVSKNAARRVLARHRRLVPVDDATLSNHSAVETLDVDAIASRVDARDVHSALSVLNRRERDIVLLLAARPGAGYVETADLLGCPVGSLGPTRQRALAKLRRHQPALAASV